MWKNLLISMLCLAGVVVYSYMLPEIQNYDSLLVTPSGGTATATPIIMDNIVNNIDSQKSIKNKIAKAPLSTNIGFVVPEKKSDNEEESLIRDKEIFFFGFVEKDEATSTPTTAPTDNWVKWEPETQNNEEIQMEPEEVSLKKFLGGH